MNQIPLPWNAKFSESGTNDRVSSRCDTLESNSLIWAKTHPILRLLALYPCWVVYAGVAPAFVLLGNNRSKAVQRSTSDYKLVGKMARVTLQEPTKHRQSQFKD
jgi:hypothetical protein